MLSCHVLSCWAQIVEISPLTPSNILLVNYDSWWQHQMSARDLMHERPSGRFSKSWGLSASVSFLSSPPPPRSFTCPIFPAVFDSCSSSFAPKQHRNACCAGYGLLVNALNRIFKSNLSLDTFKWLLTKVELSCIRNIIPRSRKRLWNGYPDLNQELQNHETPPLGFHDGTGGFRDESCVGAVRR